VKNLFVSFIAVALAGFLLKECRQASWNAFESPEGRFSVLMPGTPLKMEQPVEYTKFMFDRRTITFHWAGVESSFRGTSFDVGYLDFPEEQTSTAHLFKQLPQFLANRYGIKSSLKMTKEGPLELDGYAGREFEATYSPGEFVNKDLLVRGRAYYGNNRLYMLVAVVRKEKSLPDASKFLDSFRLRGPP
jgi:hypothetical protein